MHIGNLKGKITAIADFHFEMEQLYLDGILLPTKVVFSHIFSVSVQNAVIGIFVQLIDVRIDEDSNHMEPQLIILEPDYLVDVSAVAECMRDYGSHPFYFLMNRCLEKINSAPILLGNAANFFLDELVNADDPFSVDGNDTIKKYFKINPLDISTCSDLKDREKELQFFNDLKLHFEHLKSIVTSELSAKGINRDSAVLEPSFICPNLGLQGRLDFFEENKDRSVVLELKSGKTPFFGDHNHQAIGLNHQTQASLYQIMIQQVLDIPFSKLETYICYSRCAKEENPLRLAHPSMNLIAEALNIRNLIALNDFKVAFGQLSAKDLFALITPERMIKSEFFDTKLISQYIEPQIIQFTKALQNASDLERAYFFAHYQFLVKEQWLSKCGELQRKERSHSSLWMLDASEKRAAGTLVSGLKILSKDVLYEYTIVTFSYEFDYDFASDFREGDIVVLFPNRNENDNATKHQVYKGNILTIEEERLVLRLRNHHKDQSLPIKYSYSIEHDVLDNNYTAQFRGLYKFLSTDSYRKDLLLGLRKPNYSTAKPISNKDPAFPIVQNILQKVAFSNELFLLVGPPGTGKTSIALKGIVDHYYKETNDNILIAAYTNRAVDEICLALENIQPEVEYMRLGSHINCPIIFQKRLLTERIKQCNNRNSVNNFIQEQRIYIGTVAALSSNTELLKNKHFELAIIDEASQILDPQMLNLFCTKSSKEQFSIDKFILIGDYKQLPAVCLQENADFGSDVLNEFGIYSGKMSFFERMFRLYHSDENIVMQMELQGRMHPTIADFANKYFYNETLNAIPLEHQKGELNWTKKDVNSLKEILSNNRTYYFPISELENAARIEAELTVDIARSIFEMYQDHDLTFDASLSLGIIAPFRSQVALIRKYIRQLGIDELNNVVVDTVERYQGSQKDIIIFAFGVYTKTQLQQVTDAVTVFENEIIDRKLNVALTRARKQFFFVGSSYWIRQDKLYSMLVDHISKQNITI